MKGKSGEIWIGIIVTVVGGLILAVLVGEGRFAPSPTADESRPTIEVNSFEEPEEDIDQTALNTTSSEPPPPDNIPGAIENPVGRISADKPVIMDDYLLIYPRDGFYIGEDCVDVGEMYIQNLGDRERTFRYARSGISLIDDMGNSYAVNRAYAAYEVQSLSLSPGETAYVGSSSCACFCDAAMAYEGAPSVQVGSVIMRFDQFGPFTGFEMEIPID